MVGQVPPNLLTADDLRQTIKTTRAHFGEWFVAVHLYETEGALSLVEKYCYRNQPAKVELLDSSYLPKIAHFSETSGYTRRAAARLVVYIPTQTVLVRRVKVPDRLQLYSARATRLSHKRFAYPCKYFMFASLNKRRCPTIVGRERRDRVLTLDSCGGGCFDSRRRVNSNIGMLSP